MAKKKTKKKAAKKSGKKVARKAVRKAKKKSAGKRIAAKKTARKSVPKKKTDNGAQPATAPILQTGQLAPDFELPNENGETIRLSDLRGKQVVLYFYPKDDTPGCTQESCDFRDNYARVKSVGAEVFGISKDDIVSHTKFKNKFSLPFSLLADTEGKTLESYGVWKEKNMYGRKYMGIERTTFIIDADGKVKKVYPKVSVTGHVDQVLEDLK